MIRKKLAAQSRAAGDEQTKAKKNDETREGADVKRARRAAGLGDARGLRRG